VIVVTLRGEPRGKGRPRSRIARNKSGQQFIAVYTDAETRAYEKALAWAGKAAMGSRQPLTGPLTVAVDAVMAVPASWSRPKRDRALAGVLRPIGTPDVDNIMKVIDGLQEIVFYNDSQIVEARIAKRYGEEPLLRIEVEAVAPPLMGITEGRLETASESL
jgi:Holliday junction resolvase RusA-like endonuclease